MCIYCGTTKYRKIYEHHYGSIPKEDNGRSYEIHHIDGNHTNNNPNNIIAVSLKEHYDIHYSQQDFGACFLLAQKMKLPYNQISELNRLQNLKRIEKGTHNLMRREDGTSHASDRVQNGTHHFLKPGQIPKKKSIPKRKNGEIHSWKHLESGKTERLSMSKFIKKYNLESSQGNISQLVRGKLNSVKGWIIGI
jgi:hypothetical protein